MHKINTIIFDMDGVIIDSEPIHMKIERDLLREIEVDISIEEHQQYVGTSAREMWEDIAQKYQLEIPADEILEKKYRRYLNELTNTTHIKDLPGVASLIKYLHDSGKSLALASSATREEIKLVLDKLKLNTYFPITVSGADLERSKPDPQIFIEVSKLSKTPPGQCCVIEDSQNGVLAAKAAGMRCIGFNNPNSGDQDLSKADGILDNFDQKNREQIISLLLDVGQVS